MQKVVFKAAADFVNKVIIISISCNIGLALSETCAVLATRFFFFQMKYTGMVSSMQIHAPLPIKCHTNVTKGGKICIAIDSAHSKSKPIFKIYSRIGLWIFGKRKTFLRHYKIMVKFSLHHILSFICQKSDAIGDTIVAGWPFALVWSSIKAALWNITRGNDWCCYWPLVTMFPGEEM